MGESGSWTINYIPDGGGRITGQLLVSDDGVRFRAMYDSSFKTIAQSIGLAVGSFAATDGSVVYLRQDGDDAEIVVPAQVIDHAEATKKGITKRVVVHTTDGRDFVFDYGMLSTKKIVAAING